MVCHPPPSQQPVVVPLQVVVLERLARGKHAFHGGIRLRQRAGFPLPGHEHGELTSVDELFYQGASELVDHHLDLSVELERCVHLGCLCQTDAVVAVRMFHDQGEPQLRPDQGRIIAAENRHAARKPDIEVVAHEFHRLARRLVEGSSGAGERQLESLERRHHLDPGASFVPRPIAEVEEQVDIAAGQSLQVSDRVGLGQLVVNKLVPGTVLGQLDWGSCGRRHARRRDLVAAIHDAQHLTSPGQRPSSPGGVQSRAHPEISERSTSRSARATLVIAVAPRPDLARQAALPQQHNRAETRDCSVIA